MRESFYLYYGADEFLLKEEINKLLKEFNVDEFNTTSYDLIENSFDEVIEELKTVSFFANHKIVILKNIYELYNKPEVEFKYFKEYLKKPSPGVYLIIMTPIDVDTQSNEITELLNMYAYKVKVVSPDKESLPKIIKQLFLDDGYQIETKAIEELIHRTNSNYPIIVQEITKLKLYAHDSKNITLNSIRLMVSKNLEENIFDLTAAIVNKNRTKAIEIYYDMLTSQVNPHTILNDIANRLRRLIYTQLLRKQNYSQELIAKHFGVSIGYAYYLMRDAQILRFDELEKYLDQLTDLDYQIKSGNMDAKLGIELFLLGV